MVALLVIVDKIELRYKIILMIGMGMLYGWAVIVTVVFKILQRKKQYIMHTE